MACVECGVCSYVGPARLPLTQRVKHLKARIAGAIRLAKSDGCANQAFQVGSKVIGLQFHLETTPESLDALINNCRHELVEGTYIQREPHIRAVQRSSYSTINNLMAEVLSYVTLLPGQTIT
jgi:Na+-translocating ferredoxin:NAD+ oxidoreductase RnfC subunit